MDKDERLHNGMKKLLDITPDNIHEKNLSDLVGDIGHRTAPKSEPNSEMMLGKFVKESILKEWVIAMVKNLRGKNKWRGFEFNGNYYNASSGDPGECEQLEPIEDFLIDRFEITEKELK